MKVDLLPGWFKSTCPDCGSLLMTRSHRRGLAEWIIGLLFLPYRCRERDHRFFKFRWLRDEVVAPPEQPLDSLPVIVRRAS